MLQLAFAQEEQAREALEGVGRDHAQHGERDEVEEGQLDLRPRRLSIDEDDREVEEDEPDAGAGHEHEAQPHQREAEGHDEDDPDVAEVEGHAADGGRVEGPHEAIEEDHEEGLRLPDARRDGQEGGDQAHDEDRDEDPEAYEDVEVRRVELELADHESPGSPGRDAEQEARADAADDVVEEVAPKRALQVVVREAERQAREAAAIAGGDLDGGPVAGPDRTGVCGCRGRVGERVGEDARLAATHAVKSRDGAVGRRKGSVRGLIIALAHDPGGPSWDDCRFPDRTFVAIVTAAGGRPYRSRRTIVKYAILIYDENTANPDPAPPDPAVWGPVMAEYNEYSQALTDAGVRLGGEALQPNPTATTVRIRDGRTVTTDGPFAETKEGLGGFYLIDVKDLDEALAWGARCPGAKYGTIEVRPVMDFSEQEQA